MRVVPAILFFALFLAIGCSGGTKGQPKTVPVTGTVMYNGKAVEGASVTFMADGAPRAATGVTDAEGKFSLSTFGANDGAVIGTHIITVSKGSGEAPAQDTGAPPASPDALAETMKKHMASKQSDKKPAIPAKYSNPKTTPLKEEVTADGTNTFVLQLKD